jgi:omega-6 fatty acid desaturase (delta-12 desaturase)
MDRIPIANMDHPPLVSSSQNGTSHTVTSPRQADATLGMTQIEVNKITRPFRTKNTARSVRQLSVGLVCYFGSWLAMLLCLKVSYLLTLALAVPTAGFLMHLFMIQHDCGHGSYFKSARARNIVGFWLGVLTLTPYRYWARTHQEHHDNSGNLSCRTFGEINTITVKEFGERLWFGRLKYRLYRNPALLLTIGPAIHFLIKHRYPWDIPKEWKKEWRSVWLTNLALVAMALVATYTIGLTDFLLVQLPVSLVASTMGVYLFYVQHQYDEAYWRWRTDYNSVDAALLGSSVLELPAWLTWLTANIGLHNVHHADSLVPNYQLPMCMEADPVFKKAKRFRLGGTWRLFSLTLWDEDRRRLIGFKELKQLDSGLVRQPVS